MTFTAKWTIKPAVIDSDDVETDYQTYSIVETVSTSKEYTWLLPADSAYYTPPMVDDNMTGLEFISDQAVSFGVFTSTGGVKLVLANTKNVVLNTIINNTSAGNVWKVMQTTGLTAANVIWRVYSST